MLQFIKELIQNNKIVIEQVVFLDFSLYSGKSIDYKNILLDFQEMYPKKEPFFVFDEIQDIANFKELVLGLYNLGYQIFLSGSNSKLLSSELSTHFRGRVFEYKVFPLTFTEILGFLDMPLRSQYATRDLAKMHNILQTTLKFGNFPEIVLSENPLFKTDNLKTYLDVLIYKDLLERYKIENEVALKFLLKSLTIGFTKYVNISKIYNTLKSQNIKIGKSTLFDYYEYIKNIFYVFELENFYNTKATKKIALYNIGFNAIYSSKTNLGQAFENLVFLELLKKYKQVFFKKNGDEIDFYIPEDQINIQVCYELTDENLERETKVFKKTKQEETNILIIAKNSTTFPQKDSNFKVIDFLKFVFIF
ncbi:ATP-binding protein [Candidatus Gracilibacteria bacterium]|nr:ATP-binding protein [Candidatus Gracilibacteria bacterium]